MQVPENSLRYTNIMLGKGKFASVFQGSWENCPVAIKALHPYCSDQAVKDFRREAEILRFATRKNSSRQSDPRRLILGILLFSMEKHVELLKFSWRFRVHGNFYLRIYDITINVMI